VFIIARSKYESHVKPRFDEIKGWRQSGESERNIAIRLGVSWQTFNVYKNEHPDFLDLLRHSKTKLINNLKDSLWKEAMGYDYVEDEKYIEKTPYITKIKDSEGNPIIQMKEKSKVRKVTKRARSQAQLLIFALTNLCPEEFKRVDKEEINRLEEELEMKANDITDKKIKDAFNKLYNVNEDIKEEDMKNDKNEETRETEDS